MTCQKRQQVLRETLEKLSEPGLLQKITATALANVSRWGTDVVNVTKNKVAVGPLTKISLEHKIVSETPRSPRVDVLPGDWGDVVKEMTKQNGVIYAALNMANAYVPGGGYVEGMVAQEENMYRRTSCHFFVDRKNMQKNEQYTQWMTDLINAKNGLVYLDTQSPRVCVRGNEATGYQWLTSDEIFPFYELRSAADDLRSGLQFNHVSSRAKIEAQFETCKRKGVRHVVLSAFGCGAFRNPPQAIAQIYKDTVTKYAADFDHVVFAIYHAGYGPDNFTPFKAVLQALE